MKDYKATTITLTIEEEQSLAILLHKDGTINRKGNGTYTIDNNFYMGIQQENLLEELLTTVTLEFEQYFDRIYDLPDRKGKTCTLEIILSTDTENTVMCFVYGSESMGPPKPVIDYVKEALKLTDPWFKEQQRMVVQNNKPWWKIW